MQRTLLFIGLSSMVAIASLHGMDAGRLSSQDLQDGVKTDIDLSLTPQQIREKIELLEAVCEQAQQVLDTGRVTMLSGETRELPQDELDTRPALICKTEEEIARLRKQLAAISEEQVELLAEREAKKCCCWRRRR